MVEQPEFDFEEVAHAEPARESLAASHAESTSPALDAPVPARTVRAYMSSDSVVVGERSPSTWQEVPQARFLSWSDGEQLAYCAARDYDAAEHEADPEWCQFYFDRAKQYERELRERCTQAAT